jgi:subtilisin family serine protease
MKRAGFVGACVLLATVCLVSCAALPDAATITPSQMAQLRESPQRLIVVAFANPSEPIASHAGSSLQAYDGAPRYAAGDSARAASAALAADYQLREVAAWPIQPLKLHCVLFEIAPQLSRDALLAELARDPRVRLAQPLQTFSTLGHSYNDPYVDLQRGFRQIDADDAQQWSRGDGVRVAVIDTGVDTSHPDLKGQLALSRNLVDDDAAQFRRDRHGTAVAGVIAAVANNSEGIVGIAPGVQLLVFKACWALRAGSDEAQCNSFTLAQALVAAIESGARIVNLSLGGPADPLLEQLLRYAIGKGQIVVGAVPPSGRRDGFPIGVAGVIAVDSDDQPITAAQQVLRAPGHEILSLAPGGHYDYASGSSLAAAHVSGALALLLAMDRHLDADAARQRLMACGPSINACVALASATTAVVCNGGSHSAVSAASPPR